MSGCKKIDQPTARKSFTQLERDQAWKTLDTFGSTFYGPLSKGISAGDIHFAITPIKSLPNGNSISVLKFAVPGSISGWVQENGQWRPRAGTGQWYSQMAECSPGDSGFWHRVKNTFVSVGIGFRDFPENAKAAVGALCKTLQEHPGEIGAATDVATMAAGAPPGSGAQAVSTANSVCSALFPPAPPGAQPAPGLPAGSITARDMKLGIYRVAVPLGLGAPGVTHVEVTSTPTAPAGAKVVTISEFEKRTGTAKWWTQPSTYVAGGAILLGAGVLGYAAMRKRRHP